jgi:ubiquinone/menaquinone biosynthesis C-methylase UbiE
MIGPHGTMTSMGTMLHRYDRQARRYFEHWAPVLQPTAHRLLDLVDAPGGRDGGPTRLLDVGTGTGVLTIESARRWPATRIDAIDGSNGMLEVARSAAEAALLPDALRRISFHAGLADRLPFEDETFGLVVSSFVYQLVPDRLRALREAWRVLEPGGRLAFVTWLADDTRFAPDDPIDRALEEAGVSGEASESDESGEDGASDPGSDAEEDRSGDLVSAAAAAAQARRAGFRAVTARQDTLVHRWTASSFLRFIEHYDQSDLFDEMDRETRRRVRQRAAALLAELPPEAFVWRSPVVFVTGRKTA